MKNMFFELAVREPGLAGWYCAVKLEMAVALTRALLTEQLRSDDVPGQASAKDKLANDLTARLGVDADVDEAPDLKLFGHVDDYYATSRVERRRYDPRPHGVLDCRRAAH